MRFLALLACSLPLADAASGQCRELRVINPEDGIDHFGVEVAVDGEWLMVGAPQDEQVAYDGGSVRVYEYDHGSEDWVLRQKLIGSGVDFYDHFGESLDMQGEWLVVGVDTGQGTGGNNGRAYIFRRDEPTGFWYEHQVIPAPTTGQIKFGAHVAIDGERMVIGAWYDTHIYTWDEPSGQWVAEGVVVAPCAPCYSAHTLDLHGDYLAIGVRYLPHDDVALRPGAAYLFEREPDGSWRQHQTLHNPEGPWAPRFGVCVALWGDRLAVSAMDGIFAQQPGAVHLFQRDGVTGKWSPTQVVRTTDVYPDSYFGWSCDMRDGALLIGDMNRQSAHLFDLDPATGLFQLERWLTDADQKDLHGVRVSLSERWAAVGERQGWIGDDLRGEVWMVDRESCSSIGTPYCGPAVPNTTGGPGRLGAGGVAQAGGEPLLLVGEDLPVGEPAVLLASLTQAFVQPPGSDGNLCLGGQLARFKGIQVVGQHGTAEFPVDTNSIPTSPPSVVQPGEGWSFQVWHRDQNPQATSNFTPGLQIDFQ